MVFALNAFPIVPMKECVKIDFRAILAGDTVIVERGLIDIQNISIWPYHCDNERCQIQDLSELYFFVSDCLLQHLSSSSFVATSALRSAPPRVRAQKIFN